MDRDELASLLAQTHSTKHSSSSSDRSHLRSQRRPQQTPTSPLSPRQIFQSRIRTLSDDENLPTAQPLSPIRQSRELRHLSSLRVHVRDADSLSQDQRLRSQHKHRSKDGRFAFSAAEPDFAAEERAAWNRDREDSAQDLHGSSAETDQGLNLRDDSPSSHVGQYEDTSVETPPALKTFRPASESVDIHERPRTSRGPGSVVDALQGSSTRAEEQTASHAIRRSKFLEGSMSDRSVGIASSWHDHGLRLSESSEKSEDSDATPRASYASRDSGSSFDISEFRPTPTTPSTIKGKLARLVKRPSEDSTKVHDEGKKQKKKGLRKSISTWSFHNIGDKMKFFGASATDLAGDQETGNKQASTPHLAELKERKRKAEEVYAQQFGTKKQKFNDRIPVQEGLRTPAQPRTLKKRSVSDRTITPATTRRRREASASASSTRSSHDPADVVGDSEHDSRKRPSRNELEKENYHLRAMLREQQAQRMGVMHRSASRSNVHLPMDNDEDHVASTRSAPRSASPGTSEVETNRSAKTSKQKQYQSKGVPPVPALPSRAVLASLGNNGRNTGVPPADTGTMKRVKGRFPRPVSMIIEEDIENDSERDGTKQEASRVLPRRMSPQALSCRKENWEWPDDVF